jgi:poly(3-hydroxybutyrate) depolymerase
MKYIHVISVLLASLHQVVARSLQDLPRAASGCGKTQFLPGVTQYRFGLKTSGKSRSYGYHIPSNYDKNKKYPVVVGFHGSSSIGTFFELDTKMSDARYSGDVRIGMLYFQTKC